MPQLLQIILLSLFILKFALELPPFIKILYFIIIINKYKTGIKLIL